MQIRGIDEYCDNLFALLLPNNRSAYAILGMFRKIAAIFPEEINGGKPKWTIVTANDQMGNVMSDRLNQLARPSNVLAALQHGDLPRGNDLGKVATFPTTPKRTGRKTPKDTKLAYLDSKAQNMHIQVS